jgi:hypothetical protein
MNYDLFISHASEDKKDFVRPLAQALQKFGVGVWYDEFSLSLGDSLSRSIDRGLSHSCFGLVVLSTDFLKKDWPEYELRGLIAKEIGADKVILPIWHNLTRAQLLRYSPPLADKLALQSDGQSIVEIAVAIIQVVRPDLFEKIMRRASYLRSLRRAKRTTIETKKIKFPPPRHDELPFNLVSRVRLIRAALLEVHAHSAQFWIDGFRGDAHPSREIRIWEHVAACYLEYLAMTPLSHEQRKDVFWILSSFSNCVPVEDLTEKASSLPIGALETLDVLWRHPLPAYDIENDPFPSEYEAEDKTVEKVKPSDTEIFPYDIPDELVFELLKQEPPDDDA